MKAVFKSELNDIERHEIENFCDLVDYFSLEQSLGFPEILYRTRITFFYLIDENKIKSFCQINENIRFAHIWFGPVCCDKELMVISINEIANYYKKQGFWYLGVQIYYKSGPDVDYIEYSLNKILKIKYLFNNENTKSSLEIDLAGSMEEINRSLSKGHKSDIKKAIKSGIRVEESNKNEDIIAFCAVYQRMCLARSMRGHSDIEIKRIIGYLNDNHKGKLLVAKDSANAILGGSIFAFQGISVRYLLSASDPGKRDLPITHLIIYRALEMAKSEKFKYFDFWGYNHFAEKDDQIYNVNRFKKGFGGYYTFFAKKMNIDLIPGGYNIYRLFGVMKRMKSRLS